MKLLKNILLIFLIFIIFSWISLYIYLTFYNNKNKLNNYDLVVVFGAGITKDGFPSPALKLRLDKSIQLYKSKFTKKILISGKIYEVYVMKNYLNNNSIDNVDIIVDINGKNTYWTINNTLLYILSNNITNKIAFISQNYHIPRVKLIAYKYNLTNSDFIASDYKRINFFKKYFILLRESFALFKEILFFKIFTFNFYLVQLNLLCLNLN